MPELVDSELDQALGCGRGAPLGQGGRGQEGVGEHGQGAPAVPGAPVSELVLIETDEVLGSLEGLLDTPPLPGYPHERGEPIRVDGPGCGQVQGTVVERMPMPACIGQVHRQLGVLDLARGAGVLSLHPDRLDTLLDVTGLIEEHNRILVPEVVDDIPAQVITDRLGVPHSPREQVLQRVRAGVPTMLGNTRPTRRPHPAGPTTSSPQITIYGCRTSPRKLNCRENRSTPPRVIEDLETRRSDEAT